MVRFFPWPGLRNKMVADLAPFRKDSFFSDFNAGATFLFPSLNEAYRFDESSNRFCYSPLFIERRNDMTCYTCSSDFLFKYPELQSVIPVASTSLRKIKPTEKSRGLGFPVPCRERFRRTTECVKQEAAREDDDASDFGLAKKRLHLNY